MTDEKMLELAEQAGAGLGNFGILGFTMDELRKFATLVRRETEQIAMTELGNFLIEHDAELTFGLATGCRCMRCHSFKITEDDGNLSRVLCENESMDGLLADICALAAQEADK